MSRICSSRKLNSRPFFSVASVRMEKWAELTRIHLGSELRVNPIEEVVATKSKTSGESASRVKANTRHVRLGRKILQMRGCYHAPGLLSGSYFSAQANMPRICFHPRRTLPAVLLFVATTSSIGFTRSSDPSGSG